MARRSTALYLYPYLYLYLLPVYLYLYLGEGSGAFWRKKMERVHVNGGHKSDDDGPGAG